MLRSTAPCRCNEMTGLLPEKLYGIIGHPLGHSLSPLIHNSGFQRLGFPGVYLCWELAPEKLPMFMQAVRTLPVSGLSVTIPYKRAVVPYLDGITPLARSVGAVNTIFWDGEDLMGDNTDVPGFLAPLKDRGAQPEHCLVLGAGGAARAVLAGLRSLGTQRVSISSRDMDKSRALAEEFEGEALSWEDRAGCRPDLLVNATPLGMHGRYETMSPWPHTPLPDSLRWVYDLIYNPEETPLVRIAREAGRSVITGLPMFVHQAAAQFALWTGMTLPADEIASLVKASLSKAL